MNPKKTILTILMLALCASACFAQKNTYTGYGQGTPFETYTAAQAKAGLRPGVMHRQISLTAAQIIAMYTTPVVLVAAPGSGKTLAVAKMIVTMTRTSTAFTGGGAAIVQYDSTANGAGTQALDSTLASTVFTGSAGTTATIRNGAIISDSSTIVNKGLYLSNATAVFAAGTGTATVDVWYSVTP